jgi:hypothetical protein
MAKSVFIGLFLLGRHADGGWNAKQVVAQHVITVTSAAKETGVSTRQFGYTARMALKTFSLTSVFLSGAAAAAIAAAPLAAADPAPGCVNPDGSPCPVATAGPDGASGVIPGGPGGTADRDGASGSIPYGPEGTADRNGASGSIPYGPGGTADRNGASGGIPNGPSGSAGPGGATGCIPYVGCASVG